MRSKDIACRAQRQDCVKAQIWGRLQKMSATLKISNSTVASIILKWKTFGTTRTLPRAGSPAKLSNQGRRALVREVTKNPMVTLCGETQWSVAMIVVLLEDSPIFTQDLWTAPIRRPTSPAEKNLGETLY